MKAKGSRYRQAAHKQLQREALLLFFREEVKAHYQAEQQQRYESETDVDLFDQSYERVDTRAELEDGVLALLGQRLQLGLSHIRQLLSTTIELPLGTAQ